MLYTVVSQSGLYEKVSLNIAFNYNLTKEKSIKVQAKGEKALV
jgi:hypothetical protein